MVVEELVYEGFPCTSAYVCQATANQGCDGAGVFMRAVWLLAGFLLAWWCPQEQLCTVP